LEGGSWEKEDEGKGREEMKGLEGGDRERESEGNREREEEEGEGGGRERERRKESKFIIHFLFQLSNFI